MPESESMARLALTLSYDGTDFAGSQVQPGVRTVQGEVEGAFANLYGRHEPTVFAGRTDRGVHAAGQVVGCADLRPSLAVGTVRAALNARLPPDVAVVAVDRRPDGFHARFDARWREYRYRVWCGSRDPLVRRYVWHRVDPLDSAVMADTALRAVGEHDFAAFTGAGGGVPWSDRRQRPRGTVRTVLRCRCVEIPQWWGPSDARPGQLIEFRLVADGFLPQMVRSLVAALVEIGRGAKPSSWFDHLLASRDRRSGAGVAPANGLTFWRVGYDDQVPDDEDAHGGIGRQQVAGVPREHRVRRSADR